MYIDRDRCLYIITYIIHIIHIYIGAAWLTGEVQQLDAEREQLAQKIQLLKAKTERDEGFSQLLQGALYTI